MTDVGIVMPVYKQKTGFLRAAIRSVLKQRYRNYKLVIVIDGTTPNVVQTVRKETIRDPRVKVIVFKKNKGTAQALNAGFKVFGEDQNIKYLTWVSSDNVYYPEFLITLRRHLLNGPPELGLVYSNFCFITNRGKHARSRARLMHQREWRSQPKENLVNTCFIGASFMYKKAFALKVGKYRFTPVEDYDYWLRLTEHCDIKYVPMELMNYRLRSRFSMSRKLATSPQFYRRKRNTSKLIRLLARIRRNIQIETTFILNE